MTEAELIALGKALLEQIKERERKRAQRRREFKCITYGSGWSRLGHTFCYTRMVRR